MTEAVHKRDWPLLVAIGTLIAAIFLGGGILVGRALISDEWSPLSDYPLQDVSAAQAVEWVTADDGSVVDLPAVPVDERVTIAGTKCASEEVTVEGDLRWTAVEPPGFSIPVGSGIATRAAGCATQTFRNPVPEEVAKWAVDEFAAGREFVVVRIGGCETPVDGDRTGVEVCWQTEPFALVP